LSAKERLIRRWRQFWLSKGGHDRRGRFATRLGSLGIGPFRHLYPLASVQPQKGYIAPSAEVIDVDLRLGKCAFIGERVVVARWGGQGFVEVGEGAQINRECMLELWAGGEIRIGLGTGIQPRCQFTSAVEPIIVGRKVQIAPYCSFYSYDHGLGPDEAIHDQPLQSKGPIVIEDDAWIGVGATILSGVRIGQGAVVAAGAVVTRDVPAGAIVAGSPAKVVKHRSDMAVSTANPVPFT
jgi:acetyltransferase-like isoleucine patch superfamily enzyme